MIQQFVDESLGHAAYLVADPVTGSSLVVDPTRHVTEYVDAAPR